MEKVNRLSEKRITVKAFVMSKTPFKTESAETFTVGVVSALAHRESLAPNKIYREFSFVFGVKQKQNK